MHLFLICAAVEGICHITQQCLMGFLVQPPISHDLQLCFVALFAIISATLSGSDSDWIRGTDAIACVKPWLHPFAPYCAYSLIHSHIYRPTLCVSPLNKCLCMCVCVVWEVKLVLLSKRGRYRSKEPQGLRGARGPQLSLQTAGCARQDVGQERSGVRWWQ